MKKIFYILPWIMLAVVAFFFTLAIWGPTQDVTDRSASMVLLEETYDRIEGVYASSLSPHLTGIAEERVSCYSESPMKRLDGTCNSRYLQEILEAGRLAIDSAPKIGDFLTGVRLCPVIYSVCMGERADMVCKDIGGETRCGQSPDNDQKCAVMEARCIDSVLDMHWRGAPVTNYGGNDLNRRESAFQEFMGLQ